MPKRLKDSEWKPGYTKKKGSIGYSLQEMRNMKKKLLKIKGIYTHTVCLLVCLCVFIGVSVRYSNKSYMFSTEIKIAYCNKSRQTLCCSVRL